MPIIVGKEAVSVTLNYYKGNPFNQDFTISGAVPASYAVAKISRIGDPDRESLILFSAGQGLVITGQVIYLSKTAQEMLLPPGQYEFSFEGTIGGVMMNFTKNSFFVIADTIASILGNSSAIIATAISGSEVNVVWNPIANATQYLLERSLDGITWAAVYYGPNTTYPDDGLVPVTLYHYRVSGTGPGFEPGGYAQTNATTLAANSGAGFFIPAGGENGMVLTKVGEVDGVATWAFLPASPAGTVYIEQGSNVTITGSGTVSDPYIVNSVGGVGGGGLPVGGQEGQLLTKNTNADGDAGWQDPPETPEQIVGLVGNLFSA